MDPGSDCALDRLTTHFLHRARCSQSYGNAPACAPWMWKRWAQGGLQTMCSESFTPATDMSTVSVQMFIHGGEKDTRGGGGAQHHPGEAAGRGHWPGQVESSGSVLSLSWTFFPQIIPWRTCLFYPAVFPHLITPRLLLSQSRHHCTLFS